MPTKGGGGNRPPSPVYVPPEPEYQPPAPAEPVYQPPEPVYQPPEPVYQPPEPVYQPPADNNDGGWGRAGTMDSHSEDGFNMNDLAQVVLPPAGGRRR